MRRLAAPWLVMALLGVAGTSDAVAQSGSLDVTFGGDGKVTTRLLPNGGNATAVAIQPDGKIVVAGSTGARFALARYDPTGSLDRTFGEGGVVTTRFLGQGARAEAVALQPDGRIVVVGFLCCDFPKIALARYEPDGSLDVSFGRDGRVTSRPVPSGGIANAVAIQPDGRLVVAGGTNLNPPKRFALARYDPNGSPDRTFGEGGVVTTRFLGEGAAANALTLQPDGRIVAAGWADGLPALARYHTDGTLDTSFDGDGKIMTEVACCPVGVLANDATIQPDGRIVIAGEHFECFGGPGFSCESVFFLARYASDGSLDPTFGQNGLSFGVGGSAYALALQADGKIVAVGEAGFGEKFAIARYGGDGILDNTFGGDGRVFVNFLPRRDIAQGVAIDAAGRIVAAGSAAGRFAIARIMGS